MKKLIKQYDFTTPEQYYDYVAESYVNGQLRQVKSLFKAMPKANRHECIEHLRLNQPNDEIHNYLVRLL